MPELDCAGGASRLAVACDDGCLRLFCADKAEQGLLYEGSMPSLKHRLLSVAWHPNAKSLVTGTSDGSLHAWDVGSKREILRVHTGELSHAASLAGCQIQLPVTFDFSVRILSCAWLPTEGRRTGSAEPVLQCMACA